jgi:hypothetical protein
LVWLRLADTGTDDPGFWSFGLENNFLWITGTIRNIRYSIGIPEPYICLVFI